MTIQSKSRRLFLRKSGIALGGLSLSLGLVNCSPSAQDSVQAAPMPMDANVSDVSAWLHIDSAGLITIRIPSSEMGQGVLTSLAMIVAEELDADWNDVRSETAPMTATFLHPEQGARGTGGSSSVRKWWPYLAVAGASAKAMLMSAAAQHWGVPSNELTATNSVVSHASSGRTLSYAQLADAAGKLEVPQNPILKNPEQYTLIAKPLKRLDSKAKVNGSAQFGIDVQVPSMLYATIAASPNFVGALTYTNDEAAKRVDGVEAIVRMPASTYVEAGIQQIVAVPDAVAVVATSYWQAKKGLDALQPEFEGGSVEGFDNNALLAGFMQALDREGVTVREDGSVQPSLEGASSVLESTYSVPFLAHMSMEPINCTAFYIHDAIAGDRLEIWAPTQGESHTISVLQKAFSMPAQNITLHTTLLGGGFGRRYEADFVLQAAVISKAVSKPVKLIWSREEDTRHDYYRPASVSRFTVGLDADGYPIAWQNHVACPSVAQRNFSAAMVNGFDPFSIEGAINIPYGIEHQKVSLVQHDTSIPVGSWRSVGSSHNGFYVESMMDEIAVAGGIDPFVLRRKLLSAHPRFLRVLDILESESEWKTPAAPGRFRGMAIHESFMSIVGEVAEISVDSNGAIRVHKMNCVIDCGKIVNPAIINSQLESAMIDGLTAALRGGVRIENGAIVQGNFDTYSLMRLAEVPEMQIHIVASDVPAGGIGEPAVPPSMPALANAISAATGKRIRSLPIEFSLTA